MFLGRCPQLSSFVNQMFFDFLRPGQMARQINHLLLLVLWGFMNTPAPRGNLHSGWSTRLNSLARA